MKQVSGLQTMKSNRAHTPAGSQVFIIRVIRDRDPCVSRSIVCRPHRSCDLHRIRDVDLLCWSWSRHAAAGIHAASSLHHEAAKHWSTENDEHDDDDRDDDPCPVLEVTFEGHGSTDPVCVLVASSLLHPNLFS